MQLNLSRNRRKHKRLIEESLQALESKTEVIQLPVFTVDPLEYDRLTSSLVVSK